MVNFWKGFFPVGRLFADNIFQGSVNQENMMTSLRRSIASKKQQGSFFSYRCKLKTLNTIKYQVTQNTLLLLQFKSECLQHFHNFIIQYFRYCGILL